MRVAVIGAGVVGASAAWWLARAGAEPVLIDPEAEGRATAAGAGIVVPWARTHQPDPDWHRRGAAAGRFYPEMITALGEDGETDTGYARCGAMIVDADPAVLDGIERDLIARHAEAPGMGGIARLDPAQARAAFPPLHPAMSAIHVEGGARVDGRRLAAALRRAAARRGTTEMHGAARLIRRPGGTGVQVDGTDVPADAVLVAAGAWSAALLAEIGLRLPVAPQRGQIVHLRADTDTSAWPAVLPLPIAVSYLVTFEGGRVVAGATRETGSGFDYRLTAAGQAQVLADALRVAPGLGGMGVIEWRIGFRPLADDLLPLLGPAQGVPGLFVATGLGGGGLTLGPLSGRLIAEAILGQPPLLDLAPFAPLRGGMPGG
ncbi:MAG: FAD-binding oxidoreductase [Proteobacteria bacterium]|nr:FAD-binding oxidoreductase [Pseudomonadota bacterium]